MLSSPRKRGPCRHPTSVEAFVWRQRRLGPRFRGDDTLGRGSMLETTLAGSLPKPAWLAEPQKLWAAWRLEGATLAEGKRDAVLACLKRQEDAGIDIVTDGEQSRHHFVHGFLVGLSGLDFAHKRTIGIRKDRYKAEAPVVPSAVKRTAPVHGDEIRFMRA